VESDSRKCAPISLAVTLTNHDTLALRQRVWQHIHTSTPIEDVSEM
jgi:hypothetical protein